MTDSHLQEPDLGTVIGGCCLEGVIGRGGMGVVYVAEQQALSRKVAVKVIAAAYARDVGFRQRFERESRLAASIDHPNIVPVYSAGEEAGRLYIVMRLVRGTDLRGVILTEGRLDPGRAVRLAGDLAGALDAAHARGLVHRDVKPGNVLLESSDSGECVYLTDFGLTKDASSQSGVTHSGQWVGTLDYIAPEQLERGAVDARADIYALGCVLFEMLAGQVPYQGSDVQKMWAHVNLPPPSLESHAPAVAARLDPVIQRATAKAPEERFPSAGDLARAAAAAMEGAEVDEPERTVATGTAAPDAPVVIVGGSPPSRAQTRAAGAPDPPRREGRAGARQPFSLRLSLVLAVGMLLAAGGVAVALLGSGDDDGGGGKKAGKAQKDKTSSRAVRGGKSADRLIGTDGADRIVAGAANDRVEARGGDDRVDGGAGEDVLDGGDGDDVFAASEDDAVDIFHCGPGDDVVLKPDTRDVVGRDCERVGWTARPLGARPFENRIAVVPEVGEGLTFAATCRADCTGTIELRTPATRELLGNGRFRLAAGKEGPISATLTDEGRELVAAGGKVRVVLRAAADGSAGAPVNSGFTTFIKR